MKGEGEGIRVKGEGQGSGVKVQGSRFKVEG
jgi:hypothetical protein